MKKVQLVKLVIQPFYIVLEDGVVVGDISSEKPLQVFEADVPRIQDSINDVTERMLAHVTQAQS